MASDRPFQIRNMNDQMADFTDNEFGLFPQLELNETIDYNEIHSAQKSDEDIHNGLLNPEEQSSYSRTDLPNSTEEELSAQISDANINDSETTSRIKKNSMIKSDSTESLKNSGTQVYVYQKELSPMFDELEEVIFGITGVHFQRRKQVLPYLRLLLRDIAIDLLVHQVIYLSSIQKEILQDFSKVPQADIYGLDEHSMISDLCNLMRIESGDVKTRFSSLVESIKDISILIRPINLSGNMIHPLEYQEIEYSGCLNTLFGLCQLLIDRDDLSNFHSFIHSLEYIKTLCVSWTSNSLINLPTSLRSLVQCLIAYFKNPIGYQQHQDLDAQQFIELIIDRLCISLQAPADCDHKILKAIYLSDCFEQIYLYSTAINPSQ